MGKCHVCLDRRFIEHKSGVMVHTIPCPACRLTIDEWLAMCPVRVLKIYDGRIEDDGETAIIIERKEGE